MFHRTCAALAALSVVAASVGAAGAAGAAGAHPTATAAATKKVALNVMCVAHGKTKIVGASTGAPIGKAKVTGTLALPSATLTLTTHKGSATLAATGRVAPHGHIAGSWHWVKGTGAFHGIKGGGNVSGSLSCQPWIFKGTARY